MLKRRSGKKQQAITDVVALPLLLGGAALAAADLGRRVYRHTQLFCPSRDPVISWDPSDYGIPSDVVEEHWIETPDGQELHAWYCRSRKPIASGVLCHGNTGNLTTTADVVPHLLSAGMNVLLFDYRGFGKSTGRVSFRGVVADGITAARFHETLRPPELPSILYGFSLGGAVAAQVIRRHHVDGLILQSTFTSLPQITRVLFPRAPLHLLAGDLFDTLRVVRRLHVPLLVLHGTDDEVVPCWMAHELFDACETPKRIHCVDRGLHKDLFIRDPDGLVRAVSQFIADLPRSGASVTLEEPAPFEEWTASTLRALRRLLRRRSLQQV